MTDIHGNLLWYGEYTAWGRLKKVGRFLNQDQIGLMGGTNFYQFSMNALGLIDPLVLSKKGVKAIIKKYLI